jgi:hypothetical protein
MDYTFGTEIVNPHQLCHYNVFTNYFPEWGIEGKIALVCDACAKENVPDLEQRKVDQKLANGHAEQLFRKSAA